LDYSGHVVLLDGYALDLMVSNEVSQLRAQLNARDVALDALLDWADVDHPRANCDSRRETIMRNQVAALHAVYGVHPKC